MRKVGILVALWLALGSLPLALIALPPALGIGAAFAQQLPAGPGSVPKLRHGPNGEIEPVPDSATKSSSGVSPAAGKQPKKSASHAKPAPAKPAPATPAAPSKEAPPAKAPEKPAAPVASPAASPGAANSAKHFVEPIAKSDLAVDLVDFVKVPPSGTKAPLAAIDSLVSANDGSGRLFVSDMRGKIYVIRDGKVLETPFLDLAAARKPYFRGDEDESGLLGFAFHPDFAKPGTRGFGKLYTIDTENLQSIVDSGDARVLWDRSLHPDHFNVLAEWSVDPKNPDRVDPASRREVLRFGPWGQYEAGGQLAFDPNLKANDPDYGLLYIGVGDGGDSAPDNGGIVDIHRQPQNTAVPFGKILRIDPLQNGKARYAVPPDNPFVNQPGFLPEIWAYGLRNPERFSWDRGGTHKMVIADIGQANIEEIDLGQAGANYGWSTYEGRFTVDHENEKNLQPPPNPLPAGYVFPAAEYDHSEGYAQGRGTAAAGGFVYRGKALPQLAGKYIFGDIVSGDIFYVDADTLESGKDAKIYRLRLFYRGKEMPMLALQKDAGSAGTGILGDASRADLRFGIDQDGEIYVLTKTDGMIRKLAAHSP